MGENAQSPGRHPVKEDSAASEAGISVEREVSLRLIGMPQVETAFHSTPPNLTELAMGRPIVSGMAVDPTKRAVAEDLFEVERCGSGHIVSIHIVDVWPTVQPGTTAHHRARQKFHTRFDEPALPQEARFMLPPIATLDHIQFEPGMLRPSITVSTFLDNRFQPDSTSEIFLSTALTREKFSIREMNAQLRGRRLSDECQTLWKFATVLNHRADISSRNSFSPAEVIQFELLTFLKIRLGAFFERNNIPGIFLGRSSPAAGNTVLSATPIVDARLKATTVLACTGAARLFPALLNNWQLHSYLSTGAPHFSASDVHREVAHSAPRWEQSLAEERASRSQRRGRALHAVVGPASKDPNRKPDDVVFPELEGKLLLIGRSARSAAKILDGRCAEQGWTLTRVEEPLTERFCLALEANGCTVQSPWANIRTPLTETLLKREVLRRLISRRNPSVILRTRSPILHLIRKPAEESPPRAAPREIVAASQKVMTDYLPLLATSLSACSFVTRMVDDCQGNPVRGRELRVLENDQIVQIRAKGESVPIADGVTMACLARGNVVGQVSDEVRSAFTVLRERPVYEGGFHLSIDNEGPGDSAAVDEALSEVISRYDLPRPIEEKLFRLDDFGRDVFGYRIASTIGSLHIVARGFDYTPRRGLTRARESFLRKVQSFPLIGAPLAPSADYSESQQRSPSLIGNSPALFLQNICDQLSTAIWPTEDRFLVRGSRLKRITLRAQIGDEVVHCQGFDLRSERARRNANLLLIGEFVEKGVLTTHPFNDAVARALDHRHEMLCKFPELENPLGIVGA